MNVLPTKTLHTCFANLANRLLQHSNEALKEEEHRKKRRNSSATKSAQPKRDEMRDESRMNEINK